MISYNSRFSKDAWKLCCRHLNVWKHFNFKAKSLCAARPSRHDIVVMKASMLGLLSLGAPIQDNALSRGPHISQTPLTGVEVPIPSEDPIGNL